MILNELLQECAEVNATITLPFDLRQKSRFKSKLDSGEPVSLLLSRGLVLRDGNVLKSESGFKVKVVAAPESVSTVYSDNVLMLLKASYHLGNRHVPLQITETFVRYQADHVLDQMINQLGLQVLSEKAAFEPESGAYAKH